jgi:proline racemase
VPGIGIVKGDVAWGGNWFFLIADHGQDLSLANAERLTDYCWRVRQALNAQGFPDVDHVELFGAPTIAAANSRNFVLCPGKAYDRSPCGTGTSASSRALPPTARWRKATRGCRRHPRRHVHRPIPLAGCAAGKVEPSIPAGRT